ncbi:MAG: Na(+)-translocating NADH-quinone reductase subunit A [Bacteroidota bacterium]
MKSTLHRAVLAASAFIVMTDLSAQSGSASGSNIFIYTLVGIAVILFFGMLINVADNLIGIEAKQNNIDVDESGLQFLPGLRHLFRGKTPAYVSGTPVTILEKGHDILLEGAADGAVEDQFGITRVALQPTSFLGLQPIPKLTVAVGDNVKAGDQIFYDKKMPEVAFVTPVSGEVIEVNRGAKRAITEIVILADKEQQYRQFDTPNAHTADRADLVNFLKESGGWTLLRQRPYNTLPSPEVSPRDIFVSTFDTAPLAPNGNVVIAGQEEAFQRGIDVLSRLTDGQVHLGLDANGDDAPAAAFRNASNASKRYFRGQHPAGNVGVQIHHTAPVGGSDVVWTLGVQEVVALGNLFLNGQVDGTRIVALVGAELNEPKYVRTYAGANIGELLKDNLKQDNVRLISGDVLSGQQKTQNSYLNFYDDQLTVIEEGNYYEMFGWLVPSSLRPTISNTFPNFLFPDVKFEGDTNTHGEKRAFVVTNDYEQVMPMDIYTQQLMKSIIINDIERMEGLGILEVVEEDVALCEFVCVSKQPLQQILREGLETMREQS